MSTVLVIDDEPQILRLVEETLRVDGHEVSTVTRCEEALKIIETEQVDLVVLDIMMPGMSGLDLLARLREDSSTRGLPVILISALSDDADRIKGLKAGAADYICKPFVPEELLLRANRILASSPRRSVLRGRIEFVPLAAVLQNLLQGPASGTLEVMTSHERGELNIIENRVIAARFGEISGRDAVLAMLDLDQGIFSFRLKRSDSSSPVEVTAEISVQDVIFTAAWLADELARRPPVSATDLLWPASKEQATPEVREEFELLPIEAVWAEIQNQPGLSVDDLETRVFSALGMVRLSVALLIEMAAVNTTSPVLTPIPDLQSISPEAEFEASIHRLLSTVRAHGHENSMVDILLAVEPGVYEDLLKFRMEIPSRIMAAPSSSLAAAWHIGRAATLALRCGADTLVLHIASVDREAAAVQMAQQMDDFAAAAIWTTNANLISPIRTIADAMTSSKSRKWGLLIAKDAGSGPQAGEALRDREHWQVHLGAPKNFAEILNLLAAAGSAEKKPIKKSTPPSRRQELRPLSAMG